MAAWTSTLANSQVMNAPALTDGVPAELWSSGTITTEPTNSSARVFVNYESISPDAEVVTGADFKLQLVFEKLFDTKWLKIGAQNIPIIKREQGAVHEAFVSPSPKSDEGLPAIIANIFGGPDWVRNFFIGDATGSLRARILVVDNATGGPQPFSSITASVVIQRWPG